MTTAARPGDPLDISHRDWNDLLAMRDWWRRGGPNAIRQPDRSEFSQTRAWVKNTSAVNRGQYEILGISGSPLDPAYSGWHETLALNGTTPTTASHSGKFAVTLEPIPAGAIGRCCVAGVTQCKLLVGSTSDLYAEVTNNNGTYLTTGSSGSAQVLYPPSAIGQGYGIIRIGPPSQSSYEHHRGITNMAIAKGTSDKTVSRYLPGTTTDSGTDDTVTNEGIDIGSGKVVYYFKEGSVYYIDFVECPPT